MINLYVWYRVGRYRILLLVITIEALLTPYLGREMAISLKRPYRA